MRQVLRPVPYFLLLLLLLLLFFFCCLFHLQLDSRQETDAVPLSSFFSPFLPLLFIQPPYFFSLLPYSLCFCFSFAIFPSFFCPILHVTCKYLYVLPLFPVFTSFHTFFLFFSSYQVLFIYSNSVFPNLTS